MNILDKIIEFKQEEVAKIKSLVALDALKQQEGFSRNCRSDRLPGKNNRYHGGYRQNG